VDTGAINPGWPVDVELTAQYNGTDLHSSKSNAISGTRDCKATFFMLDMGATRIAAFIMAGSWECP